MATVQHNVGGLSNVFWGREAAGWCRWRCRDVGEFITASRGSAAGAGGCCWVGVFLYDQIMVVTALYWGLQSKRQGNPPEAPHDCGVRFDKKVSMDVDVLLRGGVLAFLVSISAVALRRPLVRRSIDHPDDELASPGRNRIT